MKQEVKLLRRQLNKCEEDGLLVSLQESLNFFGSLDSFSKSGDDGFEIIKSTLNPIADNSASVGWCDMEKIDVKPHEV
jgi:hypothetical protein